MPRINQLTAVWKNIKEFEIAPIREEGLRDLKIALVGTPGSGRTRLALHMQKTPYRKTNGDSDQLDLEVYSPLMILDLDAEGTESWAKAVSQTTAADLTILLVDPGKDDLSIESSFCRMLGNQGHKVLLFCNTSSQSQSQVLMSAWAPWHASAVVYTLSDQVEKLLEIFVPSVLELLPDHHLTLGRSFPLFRVPIARLLISDTCYTNAAYAVGTGIAEVVPALNLPLNITDMIVLTKAQAFLAYRLGLLLGFSTAWQDYLAEFGSVIGSSFIWRQLARSLVGLIPVWGIIPKVAVAYAGTYVVGHSILQWYLTGRHLNPKQVRNLYRQALARGKQNAKNLLQRAPRPRFPQLKKRNKISEPQEITLPTQKMTFCPACGQTTSAEGISCQHCGQELPIITLDD